MKVLITGGAGFIGSHLADALLAANHQVMVIDNFSTGRSDNLEPHSNLRLMEGTIANADFVNQCFDSFFPDMVVHAAASYKDPNNWTEDVLTNVMGTIHIVEASKRTNVRRLIYFQTALCYGLKPLEQPITLTHPFFSGSYSGGSSYAISKTSGEQYIELSGLDFISFRLANAYGPRNLSGPLPTFYQRLTEQKSVFVMDTRRDFIYVQDLIEVVMKALNGKGHKGFYHISSGSDFSIKELFDAVIETLGVKMDKPVDVRPRGEDDVFTILIDPSKTNKDFDWHTSTPLQSGVNAAIQWYKAHEINQTFTHLKPTEEKK